MTSPKKLWQSASRDETFSTCTQLYAAKYLYKIPDPGNAGANRGNVVHDALELLLKARHKKVFDAAVTQQTCTEVPALWRLILRYAHKYGVEDAENLKLIDAFMMVGVMHEFHGPNPLWLLDPKKANKPNAMGTISALAERAFEIEVDEPDGRKYRIKGYIDKTFIIRDELGLLVSIIDYKSSKAKFNGEKASFNTQKIIYELAARRLHPEITRRRFRFLFLKFPRQPWQEEPAMTDEQLQGYEWVLTDMQQTMEAFTVENAGDNLAVNDGEKKWLCGREGTKADGSPAWICAARRPLDFFVLLDDKGEVAASDFTEAPLQAKMKQGQRIEHRHYPGCIAYYGEGGRRRSFK